MERMDLLDENVRASVENVFETLNTRNVHVFPDCSIEAFDTFRHFGLNTLWRILHTMPHMSFHFD